MVLRTVSDHVPFSGKVTACITVVPIIPGSTLRHQHMPFGMPKPKTASLPPPRADPIILPHETSRTIQSGPHELRSNQAISGDEEGAGPLCTNAAIAASISLESLALTTTTSRPIADATVLDSMRPLLQLALPRLNWTARAPSSLE